MNGLTNSILSLLLGWIRWAVDLAWSLFSGESGEKLLSFLRERWMALVCLLALCGFAADRLIYFFRWRPDTIWRRRREAAWEEEEQDESFQETAPFLRREETPLPEADAVERRRGGSSYAASGYLPTRRYSALQDEHRPQTVPTAQPTPVAPAQEPVLQDFDPVFDDDLGGWAQSDELVGPAQEIRQAAQGVEGSFGAAIPEPADYLRDMQAGFARPLPPEQIYTPNEPTAPGGAGLYPSNGPQESGASVHPGLDAASFRRNFGWDAAEEEETQAPSPAFRSFVDDWNERNDQTPQSRNPFASLARKARDLVGVDQENDARTIRDLQPPVKLGNAFHEPVYPRETYRREEDRF